MARAYCGEVRRLVSNLARPASSAAELECASALGARGIRLTKRGWPDFFCVDPRTGGVFFVEVKGPGDKLSKHQRFVCGALAGLGVPVFLWRQGVGFEPVRPNRAVRPGGLPHT